MRRFRTNNVSKSVVESARWDVLSDEERALVMREQDIASADKCVIGGLHATISEKNATISEKGKEIEELREKIRYSARSSSLRTSHRALSTTDFETLLVRNLLIFPTTF